MADVSVRVPPARQLLGDCRGLRNHSCMLRRLVGGHSSQLLPHSGEAGPAGSHLGRLAGQADLVGSEEAELLGLE